MQFTRIVIQFIKVGISGILAIVLLSLFTLFYNNSGVHIRNPSGATDYTWEPNQEKANMTEGFAWFRMDENGFNNTVKNTKEGIDILLMGSSQMEALVVNPEENTGYLLNCLLPNLYTYNIGISGHVIYNCVNNMEHAVSVYQPEKYVILETNSVELSIENMKKVIGGGVSAHPIL